MSEAALKTIGTTPDVMLATALNKGADMAQIEKLMDLQERWEAKESVKAFHVAVSEFQSLCPIIEKTKSGVHGAMYAPLEEIVKTIRPHMKSCGLSYSFNTELTESSQITVCTIRHAGGHSESSTFAAPVDASARMNDMQKAASASTYGKRYALCNALGIVTGDEDDDAGTMEYISQEQAANIKSLMSEVSADEKKFLQYMSRAAGGLPVNRVADIPEKLYKGAIESLEKKRK